MRVIDCDQRSPEWIKARLGVPSASSFDCIVTTTGQQSKQRTKYLYRLAGERITGVAEESFQSAAMLKGVEMEAKAREFYSFLTDQEVQKVGFCISDDCGAGASPDGLVGDNGLLEIKCPIMSTHVGYLLKNELPSDYFQQTQGQLLITGREWVDFLSFYPGMRPLLIRVTRENAFILALRNELIKFNQELDDITEKIR